MRFQPALELDAFLVGQAIRAKDSASPLPKKRNILDVPEDEPLVHLPKT